MKYQIILITYEGERLNWGVHDTEEQARKEIETEERYFGKELRLEQGSRFVIKRVREKNFLGRLRNLGSVV